jgi:hypothetical protein
VAYREAYVQGPPRSPNHESDWHLCARLPRLCNG